MSARHDRGTGAYVPPEQDPLWCKTAVTYVAVGCTFSDGNSDGSGDVRGLTQRLD